MSQLPLKSFKIQKWQSSSVAQKDDLLAVEEPLKIILIFSHHSIIKEVVFTITMRSPGDDKALAVGLLFVEGVIVSFNDIEHINHCVKTEDNNTLRVTLKNTIEVNESVFQRNLISTSSCGICGKQVIENFYCDSISEKVSKPIPISTILTLPQKLENEQLLFKHTGGIHACGLFTSDGSLMIVKEDIGRHNALDKVIGTQLIKGEYFKNTIIVLSGRIGFEMSQKIAQAKIPIMVAVGAPTSLAVQIADKAKISTLGFVKGSSVNCYTMPEYIDFEN